MNPDCPDCEGSGHLRRIRGGRASMLDRFAEPDEWIPCSADDPRGSPCEKCGGLGRAFGNEDEDGDEEEGY